MQNTSATPSSRDWASAGWVWLGSCDTGWVGLGSRITGQLCGWSYGIGWDHMMQGSSQLDGSCDAGGRGCDELASVSL